MSDNVPSSPPSITKKKSSVLAGKINEVSLCIVSLKQNLKERKDSKDFIDQFLLEDASLEIKSLTKESVGVEIKLMLEDKENEDQETEVVKILLWLSYSLKNNIYRIVSYHVEIGDSRLHSFYDEIIKRVISDDVSVFTTSPMSLTA